MGKKNPMQPGEKYWRWTYLREAEPGPGGVLRGVFRCDCGVEREVTLTYVRAGKSKSCGCLPRELIIAKCRKHGQSYHYLYALWSGIKRRTNNPNSRHYEWYGGRGITMHPAWVDDYVTFRDYILAELGERPSKRHSLDRIDNEGNYEPGNVRWATPAVQGSNRRDNLLLTLNGRTQTVSQWSRELNISHQTLMARMARGWTDEKVLTRPIKNTNGKSPRLITLNGRTQELNAWCEELGLNLSTVRTRVTRGASYEEALTKPVMKEKGWRR